ncbi:MAG: large conductance mechanosensitive channel protein MscL [Candidatus Binatia bacterium]
MFKEFREFAVKGNAIDLAVGVIIGAAFGKIVDSLVKDIIMPPIGKLLGGVDFGNFFVLLGQGTYPTLKAAQDAGVATLNYGLFVNTVINFLIIAFSLFLVVRTLNRMKREAPAPAASEKACNYCQMAIPLKATRCPHCTSNV